MVKIKVDVDNVLKGKRLIRQDKAAHKVHAQIFKDAELSRTIFAPQITVETIILSFETVRAKVSAVHALLDKQLISQKETAYKFNALILKDVKLLETMFVPQINAQGTKSTLPVV